MKKNVFREEATRRAVDAVGLVGGILLGVLTVVHIVVAALAGIDFVPRTILSYGFLWHVLHWVSWIPCIVIVANELTKIIVWTLGLFVVQAVVDLLVVVLALVQLFRDPALVLTVSNVYGAIIGGIYLVLGVWALASLVQLYKADCALCRDLTNSLKKKKR